MNETLLLIDGNSIINRAYFGLAGRSTLSAADGTPTGALYAFLNIYLKHIQELDPTYVCACFDLKTPTFRHEKYKEYKLTRKPMPSDLARQMPFLKDIMDAMGIPRIEMEGYEADDLIGSLSRYSDELGWNTYILSGDKDDLQLVSQSTTLLMPLTRNGLTTTERFDPAAVEEKFKVRPEQFIDLKALMGDPSDNIPGVKGIGEKGATDLIVRYQSLDRIYESLDDIKPAVAEKLQESKENAYLSQWLATIKRDIPIRDFLRDIKRPEMDKEKTYQLFHRLGFRSVIQRMHLAPESAEIQNNPSGKGGEDFEADPAKTKDPGVGTVASASQSLPSIRKTSLQDLLSVLEKAPLYQFPETDHDASDLDPYIADSLKGRPLSNERGFLSFLPAADGTGLIDCGETEYFQIERAYFAGFFAFTIKEKIRVVSMESKSMIRNEKIDTKDLLLFDVFVAAYLLSQTEGKATLERIAEICLGEGMPAMPEMNEAAADRQQSLFDNSIDDSAEQEKNQRYKATCELNLLHRIAKVQYKQICSRGLEFLAIRVEMPLIGILADMENLGFAIDRKVLEQLNTEMSEKAAEIEKTIYSMAGTSFNINSPKQLGEILFKKLMLPTGKKTQSGYSTNSDVLDMLYDKHPIIKEITGYRQLTKLRSTFIEGLSKNIDPVDRRVHTTFNQTLTATGRLSSSDPNLQNIPVRQDVGREIRKAFIASEGNVLVDADYSQIELRLLAELSNDPEMRDAFLKNDDIHMNTAEELFDLPRNEITSNMRSAAKTVNFSIVYGISDFGLAQDLGVSLKEAHSYIAEYYKKYPGVKNYLERLVKEAYRTGYVETLFHRRRTIHELKSANRNLRMFGERVAMNTPVQGTAADIIKIAMVLVANRLAETGSNAKLILQVHDELILEVPENEAAQASTLLKEAMESAVKLSIPFLAEVKTGKNWYHTK